MGSTGSPILVEGSVVVKFVGPGPTVLTWGRAGQDSALIVVRGKGCHGNTDGYFRAG